MPIATLFISITERVEMLSFRCLHFPLQAVSKHNALWLFLPMPHKTKGFMFGA